MTTLIVEDADFQHILRMLNTNVDGRVKVAFALTKIKGVGRRFAVLACKKAGIDLNKRAGELTEEEQDALRAILTNPVQFDIPLWFLNRKKDPQTGKYTHLVSNNVNSTLRDDWERMKKIRLHRGLRHYWNCRVRGQHTKTTGRHGRNCGLLKSIGL